MWPGSKFLVGAGRGLLAGWGGGRGGWEGEKRKINPASDLAAVFCSSHGRNQNSESNIPALGDRECKACLLSLPLMLSLVSEDVLVSRK